MSGRQLADGVAGQRDGPHSPGLHEPVQGGLEREQRGLGVLGPVQQFRVGRAVEREHHLPQGPSEVGRHVQAYLVQGAREDGVGGVQPPSHPVALAALAGEEHGHRQAVRPGPYAAGDQSGRRPALSQCLHGAQQFRPVAHGGDRAVLEPGAARESERGIQGRQFRAGGQVRGEAARLLAYGRRRTARQYDGDGGDSGDGGVRSRGRSRSRERGRGRGHDGGGVAARTGRRVETAVPSAAVARPISGCCPGGGC